MTLCKVWWFVHDQTLREPWRFQSIDDLSKLSTWLRAKMSSFSRARSNFWHRCIFVGNIGVLSLLLLSLKGHLKISLENRGHQGSWQIWVSCSPISDNLQTFECQIKAFFLSRHSFKISFSRSFWTLKKRGSHIAILSTAATWMSKSINCTLHCKRLHQILV